MDIKFYPSNAAIYWTFGDMKKIVFGIARRLVSISSFSQACCTIDKWSELP